MKKILAFIVIAASLFFLGNICLAMDSPNECCKTNQEIIIDANTKISSGVWVGPAADAFCDIDGNGVSDKVVSGTGIRPNDWGMVCLLNTVYTVTNWVFYIMTLVAVLMIIFGGFTYVTAAGDPAKAGKGKTILTYAIIGLAIALVAKLVPSLVRFVVGM